MATDRRRSSARWERQPATRAGEAGMERTPRAPVQAWKERHAEAYMLLVFSETLWFRVRPIRWMSPPVRPAEGFRRGARELAGGGSAGPFFGTSGVPIKPIKALVTTPWQGVIVSDCNLALT